MAIVTISRQFGALGRPVGMELARRLGAEYLDRQLVAAVADRAGLSVAEAEDYDERVPSLWQRLAAALTSGVPDPVMPPPPAVLEAGLATQDRVDPHERLAALTRAVICEAADRGNVIILGRGGAFALGRRPGTLHVQLHASIEDRVGFLARRMAEIPVEEIPPDTRPDDDSLQALCEMMDARRARYIRHHYDVDWMDPANYDLSIDSGRLTMSTSVDLIELAAHRVTSGADHDG